MFDRHRPKDFGGRLVTHEGRERIAQSGSPRSMEGRVH
jgi:hypothetical protein